MRLPNTLLLLLALSLSTVAFSTFASHGKTTGIIVNFDPASRFVVIGQRRYQVGDHTKITNFSGTGSGLQALQAGYPVLFSVDHGELKQITVYPKDPAARQRLGYRDQNSFPQ